ncbi:MULTISPECIES: hypothetical protein [Nonomuraea]|uniref:Uncharacterized protein n=1 Tax=Nonomuraea mangrovi TaxID=2316207 RepID=A0ABW4TCK4_9ACTN
MSVSPCWSCSSAPASARYTEATAGEWPAFSPVLIVGFLAISGAGVFQGEGGGQRVVDDLRSGGDSEHGDEHRPHAGE